MVFLPNQTPLVQIRNSPHSELLYQLSQDDFTDSMETLLGLLPNVNLVLFGCLNPGTWIDDEVISLFID